MRESSDAVSAAVETARALGSTVDAPEILANRSNLVVHLKPSPVVARVATMTAALRGRSEAWFQREVDIAGYLTARGGAVVPPASAIPPGPHRRDGFVMTFWAWQARSGSKRPSGDEAGRALAELHVGLTNYAGDLPLMAPILDDTPRILDRLRRDGWLSSMLLDDAEAALDMARNLAHQGDDVRPLHGDASLSNLLVTGQGLLWTDLEDACLGPAAWDLAVMVRSAGNESLDVLRGYGAAVTLEKLAPVIQARELQAGLWSAVLAGESLAARAEAEARLKVLSQR